METLIGNDNGKYIGKRHVLARETGETPNRNKFTGQWVLRTVAGEWVDFDQYRHDIAARYGLQLLGFA